MTKELDTKTWNNISMAAFFAALALGIVTGYLTTWINAVFMFLIVSGVFFAVSFYLRDETRGSGGPSSADGAIMGGVLLTGIGICGFVNYFLQNVTVTAICIIAVMIAAAGVMVIRNRRFL